MPGNGGNRITPEYITQETVIIVITHKVRLISKELDSLSKYITYSN